MTLERYAEMTLQGSGERAETVVEEFCRAQASECPVYFASKAHVQRTGFLHGLRERLHLETRVLLPLDLARELARVLGERADLDLEVTSLEEVDRAELEFRFECYSADEERRVRKVVEQELPEGVRLEGYEVHRTIEDEARGVELYSPVHDYVARGVGRYEGHVAGVLELGERLAGQDFIHPESIVLHRPG